MSHMKYKIKGFNYSTNFVRKNGAILKKNLKIHLYIACSWGQTCLLSLYQDTSCQGNESVPWILVCHVLNLWFQVSFQPSELHSEASARGSVCPQKFSVILLTCSFRTEMVRLSVHWNEGFPIFEEQGIILKKPTREGTNIWIYSG